MAVPILGAAPAAGLNTPKGMFWMGKWESGATGTKDVDGSSRARLAGGASDVCHGQTHTPCHHPKPNTASTQQNTADHAQ